ncbi:MAG: hypothetical protein E7388_06605 [Ruminococcaceae bacterium]|nr:hypothetical protein [Oscillospiraceae bacterium]
MKKNVFVLFIILLLSAMSLCSFAATNSPLVSDTNLILDGEYIKRIPINATGAEFKENFTASVTGINDNEIVKTGMAVVTPSGTFYPVIRGDVNGDGRLSTVDYMLTKRAIDASRPLEGAYYRAADIDENGIIQVKDYIKLKKVFLGFDLYGDMYILPGKNIDLKILGDGGLVYIEGDFLKAESESGYRIKYITADGVNVYLTDGKFDIKNMRGVDIVAEFETVPDADAANTKPTTIINTFYNSDADVYGVNWRSVESARPTLKYVEAGNETPENADFSQASIVTGYTTIMSGCCKNTATMDDLEVGVKYYYIVGDEVTDTWSDVCSITPADQNDGKITFFHMSDTQDYTNHGAYWNIALEKAYSTYPDADFTINTGDIVHYGGLESEWTQMFNSVSKYTHNNVLVGVAGNHEYWDSYLYGNLNCTYAHFNIGLPDNQTTQHGMYHSFDYGNIHFAVVNTGDTVTNNDVLSEAQVEWLRKDLLASDAQWKIVAMHNPMYSGGRYGTQIGYRETAYALRAQLHDMMVKYDVDLVLNGHDHVYYLSYPIGTGGTVDRKYTKETIGGIEYIVNPTGIVHLHSGCAGEQGRAAQPAGRATAIKQLSITPAQMVSYSAITVEDNKLTINFYTVPTTEENMGETQTLEHSYGIIKK